MNDIFKVSVDDEAGDNWLICWTGQDNNGHHYNVTTDHIHGSELHEYSQGAKGDAELIVKLLNWYYRDQEQAQEVMEREA